MGFWFGKKRGHPESGRKAGRKGDIPNYRRGLERLGETILPKRRRPAGEVHLAVVTWADFDGIVVSGDTARAAPSERSVR